LQEDLKRSNGQTAAAATEAVNSNSHHRGLHTYWLVEVPCYDADKSQAHSKSLSLVCVKRTYTHSKDTLP
jgi:hypothetical protein